MFRTSFQQNPVGVSRIFGEFLFALLVSAGSTGIAFADEPAKGPISSANDIEAVIQKVLAKELDRRFPATSPTTTLGARELESVVEKVLVAELDRRFPSTAHPKPLTASDVEAIARKIVVAEVERRLPSGDIPKPASTVRRPPSTPPKPVSVAVHAPEWTAADFEKFKKATSANKHVAAVRHCESLNNLALVNDEVLVLVLSLSAFRKIGEYDKAALGEARKIGVGNGAARLFDELGHELSWRQCAHGTIGAPRTSVEANATIDDKEFPSPFFIFEPQVLDATDAHNKHIFGVFLGRGFGEKIDVIAKLSTDPNYALVSRQEKNILVGIDAPLEKWSERTVQLMIALIPGLNSAVISN